MLVVAASVGGSVGVGCYLWQLYWGRRLFDRPARICDKCNSVKPQEGNASCQCGGTYDSIDNWKWVDD
jgi:hypothetical protein